MIGFAVPKRTAAALAMTMTALGVWPGAPAAAQDPGACVADSCEGMQLWSNYARLYTEDGDFFEVNVSYSCPDPGAPMEIDITARQGEARANPGAPPNAKLPCDGTVHTWDLAAQAESSARFVAGEPVELELVLRNGLHEMRVDTSQVVGEKGSTDGVKAGAEFGIERVALGYADPRLENDLIFTVTAHYNCPVGYPRDGVIRALQDGGAAVGHGYYRLLCDGTNRASQVEVTVLDINTMRWKPGPVEVINQLGAGDVLSAPSLWQRLAALDIAPKAELPAFRAAIKNLSKDACLESAEGFAVVALLPCYGRAEGQRWNANLDGSITGQDGRCLATDGDRVIVTDCDGSDTQKWTLHPREKNFAIESGGRCLSPAGEGDVKMAQCSGEDPQSWWLT